MRCITIAAAAVLLLGALPRLLEALALQEKPLVLGLECVGEQGEAAIDDYLRGGLTLGALRLRIAMRWPDSWLEHADVDAAFYRPLLRLARERHLPVFAPKPVPRLELSRRDAAIAARVRAAAARWPDARIAVVGRPHPPARRRCTASRCRAWWCCGASRCRSASSSAITPPPPGGRSWSPDTGAFVVRPAARQAAVAASR